MRRRRVNTRVKPLFLALAVFIALAVALFYIRHLLISSDYFKIKDVIQSQGLNDDFSYFKGKNVFLINLSQESMDTAKLCPDCLMVRIWRILPERIFVESVKRKPVALVKLYRYFAVDSNGVFFEFLQNPQDSGLPLITGLEKRLSGIKPGNECKIKEFNLALSIIKESGKFRNLRDYRIQRVDVGGLDDLVIFILIDRVETVYHGWQAPKIQKMLEVRISQGNIVEKIAVISGLINQEKDNLENIKYIDLRFKEPVIKFKDVK